MPKPKRTNKETFTARELGVLIEELRSEFRTVVDIAREVKAEVDGLRTWREEMSAWRLGTTDKLDGIIAELRTIRAELKTFDDRLRAVEAKVGL